MRASVFLKFFGGVPFELLDEIPLIPLGQWLLPVSIYLLLSGIHLERSRKYELLSVYRYGSIRTWWQQRFIRNLFRGALTAAAMLLLMLLSDILRAVPLLELDDAKAGKIAALWLLHIWTMHAAFLLLDFMKIKKLVPAAILLIEGITFLIGYKLPEIAGVMYGTWGMYFRSGWCDSPYGFSVFFVVLAELLLAAASYAAGLWLLETVWK